MSADDPFIGGKDAVFKNKINQQQKEILELKARIANFEAANAAGPATKSSKKLPLEDRKGPAVAAGSDAVPELKLEVDRLRKELGASQAERQSAARERDDAMSQLEAIAIEAAEREGVARSLLKRSLEELTRDKARADQLEKEKSELMALSRSRGAASTTTNAVDEPGIRSLIADIRERLAAFEQKRPARVIPQSVRQEQDVSSQPGTMASSVGEPTAARGAPRKRQQDAVSLPGGAFSVASTENNTMTIPPKKARTERKPATAPQTAVKSTTPALAEPMMRPVPPQLQRPAEKIQCSVHFGEDPIGDFLKLLRSSSANSHAASRLGSELLNHVGGKVRAADLIVGYIEAKGSSGNQVSALRHLAHQLDSLDLFVEVAQASLWKWALACKPEAAIINHSQQWETTGTFLRHWTNKRGSPSSRHVLFYDAIVIFLREWHLSERQQGSSDKTQREENSSLHELLTFARGLFCDDDFVESQSEFQKGSVPCSQVAARYVLAHLVASQSVKVPALVPIFRELCDAKGWPWHQVSRSTHEILGVMAEQFVTSKVVDVTADILHGMRLLIGFGGFDLLETVRAVWTKQEYSSRRTDSGFAKLVAMLLVDFNVTDLADPVAAPYFGVLKDYLGTRKLLGELKSKVMKLVGPEEVFVAQVLLLVGSSTPITSEKLELLEQVSVWARAHDVGTTLMEQDKLPRPQGGWGSLPRERRLMLSTPVMQEILGSARAVFDQPL